MVAGESNQPSSLADLMETAVSAAHPERISRRLKDHKDYRLPFERIDERAIQGGSPGGIQWSPALESAYEHGYDPLLWIGRGAFSEVWRCVDRSFGREVAIKVPFHDQGKDSDAVVAALQSEAELLGKLHHPGIVHAVRRSGDGRDAYLALDFIDGEDLIEHCRLLKLNERARLKLFEKVLDAVAYLHLKGIVHGDLKPDHILVRENDQPVLIDFGLSSSDSSSSLRLSDTTRVGGSGRFRAPEIANGSAVSTVPQQDVYSLGVILKELLEDPGTASIDSKYQEIIDRSTLSNPSHRWADAGAMLEALRSSRLPSNATDQSIAETPATATAAGFSSRRSMVLAATLFVAILVAGVFFMIDEPNDRETNTPASNKASNTTPVVQASLFDLALQDIYNGDLENAQQRIEQITKETAGSASWEQGHIEAMSEERGQLYPLGHLPFSNSHALCVDYDPTTQTIAYVKQQRRIYELWVKSADGVTRKIGNSIETVRAIAISPGANRVASVDINGKVNIWTLQRGAQAAQTHTLPRQADDRVMWFASDGKSLYVYSPRNRSLECWPIESPLPAKPSFVIGDCDHAYRLPSGEGLFMVATAGNQTNKGLTQLKILNEEGQITRQLKLTDGLVPSSADSGPGQGAAIVLGMPNGFVRIHNDKAGGWQKPCDLGLNEAIPAVVYSESEQRAFAALGRIHVVAADGQLVMRLGDRNDLQQLVTRLEFDNNTSTLTCISIREFWKCVSD